MQTIEVANLLTAVFGISFDGRMFTEMSDLASAVGAAKDQAERITDSAKGWIVPLARFGFASKGVVYIIIGIFAALAAFNSRRGETLDSMEALQTIWRQPFGQIALTIAALGFLGYAAWRFVQAWKDTENKGSDAKGLATRLGYTLIGVVYALSSLYAFRLLLGASDSGSQGNSSQEWTAEILSKPFGQIIVGLVGLAVIGFGVWQFVKAYKDKIREHLCEQEMSPTMVSVAVNSARAGLSARGVVFGIVGFFLLYAAYYSRATEVVGVSGALDKLGAQPFGGLLLGVVALGLILYGVQMFIMARYRRMIL